MPASPDSTSQEEETEFNQSSTSRLDVAVVDNWLIFDCPDCGQTIKIDKEDCMYEIECPSCSSSFEPLLSRETALPPSKGSTPARKRGGRRRSRPRVPGAAGDESSATAAPRPKPSGSSRPTKASLPTEGKVRLTIKQSQAGDDDESPEDESLLPKRSALDLERRRVEASKDVRLHEDKGDSELDAVIQEESGGKYKRIRVRTRKKRATEKEKTHRFYLYTGLAAFLIIGGSLYLASRMFLSDDRSDDGEAEVAAISNFTDTDPIGIKINNRDVLMNEFLAVDGIDKLLKVIRKPKRLENVIREFYAKDGFQRYNVIKVEPDSKNTEFLPKGFSRRRMTLGNSVSPLYLEKTKSHGYRLDWESLVGYGSMPWESFINNKSTRISTMRVYVSAADYYEAPFSDRQRFAVVKLEDITRKHTVYGYFLKGNLKLKNFYNRTLSAEANDPKFQFRMMLKIRYPAGAENSAQVEIVDEVHDSWLRP